jgi:RNA recognition motif-containing protein
VSKKLYVGNLSYSVDDQSLQARFQEFGEVQSAKVVIDRESGRSKGFGFVEMSSDTDADRAIETLNGQDFGGRAVTVSEARPQAPREGGGRFGGGGGGRGGPRGPRAGGGGGGGFGGGGGGGNRGPRY